MTTRPIHPTPEAILAARKAAGLSQAQAAAVVHRPSYRTWQDWERGRVKMPADAWELFLIKTGQWTSSPA
jgi:DNA-binding transcriptional regulator YiaG